MKFFLSILIALSFSIQYSYAQQPQPDAKQLQTGIQFLNTMLKHESGKCFQYFDTLHFPEVSKEQFAAQLDEMKKDFVLFDTFKLDLYGVKTIGDNELNMYTFKAVALKKNVVDDISVDLLFYKTSLLVAGMQPKKLIKENSASTSAAKETPIDSAFTATVEGKSYDITGINIVHFPNSQGLLAIQIQYELPDQPDNQIQEWAQKEGIKFAKFLLNNGYIKKANIKANELDIRLLDNIGVSFYSSEQGRGFNVMIKPEDYK